MGQSFNDDFVRHVIRHALDELIHGGVVLFLKRAACSGFFLLLFSNGRSARSGLVVAEQMTLLYTKQEASVMVPVKQDYLGLCSSVVRSLSLRCWCATNIPTASFQKVRVQWSPSLARRHQPPPFTHIDYYGGILGTKIDCELTLI